MAQCISYLNPQHVDCKTMQNHGISLSKSSSDVSQLARFLTDGSRCSQVFPKNPRGRSWFTLDVFLFLLRRPRKSLGEDCPWCQRIKFTSKVLCLHFSYPDIQMVLEYLHIFTGIKPPNMAQFCRSIFHGPLGWSSLSLGDGCQPQWGHQESASSNTGESI